MSTNQTAQLSEPSLGVLDSAQLSQLSQAITGLSREQLLWASGYLAGVGSQSVLQAAAAPQAAPQQRISVLYASQTGNAKGVAEKLGEQAAASGLLVRVQSVDEFRPRELAKESLLLLVTSTQGEGEPPESARELYRFLHSARAPRLENLRYAVFGLGDSSYEHFCKAAVDFDLRLAELGAQSLRPRVDADVEYQSEADSWSAALIETLGEELKASAEAHKVVNLSDRLAGSKAAHDKQHPFVTPLIERRALTTPQALADVRHVVIDNPDSTLSFAAGDSLGVWLRNDPELVSQILTRAELDGEQVVSFEGAELPLAQVLRDKAELVRLHPNNVKRWAAQGDDAQLQELLEDGAALRAFAAERQLFDLLHDYPLELTAQGLADLLAPLQPRLYSIASSPLAEPDEIHLTVGLQQLNAERGALQGAASSFLTQRLEEGESLGTYVVENRSFHLPEDDKPIILIGAGTGIAPFRAFLQQREQTGAKGGNWLVFGNRNFKHDFLYQADWQRYRASGLLTEVDGVFSRDRQPAYVQDRLRERGALLWQWLNDGAHLFVCGGQGMADGVHRALLDVAQQQGGLNDEGAAEFIDQLLDAGRYHRDVY